MVSLGLLAAAAPATASAATSLYPDLKTLPPRDLKLDRTDVSVDGSGQFHNVLRFSNTVWNAGEGALEIRAHIDPSTRQGEAFQRVYDTAGNYVDLDTGTTLYYHAAHQHYHFDNWGKYELWTKSAYDSWVQSGRQIGNAQVLGSKTSSCVIDEEFVASLPGTPWPAQYPASGCMPNSQGDIVEGLSPGWGDTYDYYRWGQWIDLDQTTLADGQYVLRSVTDPDDHVYESPSKSDSNREGEPANEAITQFTISGGNIVDTAAPTGTVFINNNDSDTISPKVNVSVVGRDDVSGVDQFRLSNDGNTWKTFSYTTSGSTPTTVSWDLSDPKYGGTGAGGARYVFAQFHDASGKWSTSTFKDSIDWDNGTSGAYASAVLADSPVAYWRLGETSGATALDSAGGNYGTYTNGPTLGAPSLLSSDTVNRAVTMDGTNDYVTVPDSASLSQSTKVSLEAWIKPSALPASGSFASIVTKPEAYSLQFNGPRLEFTIIQKGVRQRTQAPVGAVSTGQVYHVVGTYDGANARLYLNGSQVASTALTGAIGVNSNALTIGSWGGFQEFFKGTIDEAAVYGTALSATRVKAHSDAGGAPPPPVNAPSGLTATTASSTQINLSWTDNATNETGFVVERDTSSSFPSPVSSTVGANVTTFNSTGLTPGTKYFFRVKAKNGSAESGYSNTANATTLNPVAAPGNLVAKAVSSSRIDLTWTDNSSNETGFTVERDATGTFTNPQVFPLGANVTSYSDLGLNPGTKYFYRVKATNATDSSAYSAVANATTMLLSSTSLSCSPASVAVGNAATCTAAVTDSGSGTPSGSVGFGSDGSGSFSKSSCTLAGGSCSVNYTPSAVGSGMHEVTGSYGGDSTHTSSQGATGLGVSQPPGPGGGPSTNAAPPSEPPAPPGGGSPFIPSLGAPRTAGQATGLRSGVVTAARNWSFLTQVGVRCTAAGGCRVRVRASTRLTTIGLRQLHVAVTRTRELSLGIATVHLSPGRLTTVRIRLTPAGRRALAQLGHLRVRVSVTVTASGRRTVTFSRTLTLWAPRRR